LSSVPSPSQGHDIVAVGASAGGVQALQALVRALPARLGAAVFVTLHVTPHARSVLPSVLQHATTLSVAHAIDNEPVRPGRIYVAPPDHHLLFEDRRIRLSRGPRENGSRPAIDPMFRTAARAYGPRVLGILLSGTLDDGTAGLAAIRARGGVTIAQLPGEAAHPDMPQHAIDAGVVDHVLTVGEMPQFIERMIAQPTAPPRPWFADQVEVESQIALFNPAVMENDAQPGRPSDFSCPDCGGVLRVIEEGDHPHYRCQVGHSWAPRALLSKQMEKIEESLWAALRALEEHGKLTRSTLEQIRARGLTAMTQALEERLADIDQHQRRIREVLLNPVGEPAEIDELEKADRARNVS
jgi:two-component system, chemotaxis family, protein-glutamate methylesterase/glutaminase